VDLETDKVIGMHEGAEYLIESWGIPMWNIWKNPRIRRIIESAQN